MSIKHRNSTRQQLTSDRGLLILGFALHPTKIQVLERHRHLLYVDLSFLAQYNFRINIRYCPLPKMKFLFFFSKVWPTYQQKTKNSNPVEATVKSIPESNFEALQLVDQIFWQKYLLQQTFLCNANPSNSNQNNG